MKNASIEVTAVYRGIAKAARRLHLALDQLPAELRDDLQLATMESGGARRDAIEQLVAAAKSLNDFNAGSACDELNDALAFAIGYEVPKGVPVSPEWIR